MARKKLETLLDNILEDTVDAGYSQSDRHVSDTLVTFDEIDDILKAWYEAQWRLSQRGGSKTKGAKKAAIRTVDKDWQKLKAVRRGAFMAYKRGLEKALKGRPYGRQMRGGINDIIWRYYIYSV